ncbi:ephrin type-A receptor 8-like isoform X2 [Sycon ciliatum]|uniref:ephrin type-A receptor 8-like isoform X2 n=1 Tax=Sycon ciliatum TaxID=27933 RepID=UPI0031F6AD4D
MMRHSFPPGKVESKSTSVNMLHCVSSAEVLTKIDDVDQSTTSKDAFPDADEEPLYNDPTKRTSFQAFPGGAPNNGAALAVSNVMYEVQSANSPSAAAARSPAARSPAPLPAYSPVPAYSPAPPAVYAQPDEFTGKHSDKSSTLASYSHLSFNPKEPDPALQAKLYEEPPDTEPAIYDRLAKQQCRQIPADDIRLLDQLRYSHFGNIHRAEWKQGDTSRQVVAKTVSSGSSQELKTKLLQEGVIMGQFHHENIIRLQGLVLQGPSMMLIWEFMDKGVLNTVLATMMPNASEKPRRHVKTMLLNMTRNIASAMEYLAGKGFVHRDLAARNILVNSKNVCKIGNFNMSRDLADRDYYLSSSIGLTPQSTSKWMAPETFISHLFSSASDVWSFGVVLYEMWTFGRSPYGAWSDQKVLEKITEGYRLPRPSYCPPSLGSIMVACWNEDRTRRPTFSEIVTTLSVKDVCLL